MFVFVCVCVSECTHTCQNGARRGFSPLLYRPSAVDSVTVTFTSWPWGKKEMATLTAWTRKAWSWWCWSGAWWTKAWWQTWTFFRSKERGGPWHGGRGHRRGGEGGLPTVFKNIEKFLVVLTLAFLAKLAAQ